MNELASGFSWDQTEDQNIMCGPGARCVFSRRGAVWTHALVFPGREIEVELVRAVETDPERDQPLRIVSPVYQEIQRHPASGLPGLCLLATGTFGRHHFSAVIALMNDPARPGGVLLDIDVADRCRDPVEHLAATYTVAVDAGSLSLAGQNAIYWEIAGENEGGLELETVLPGRVVVAEAGRIATRAQALAAVQPGDFTHRLHYRWRWASRSALSR